MKNINLHFEKNQADDRLKVTTSLTQCGGECGIRTREGDLTSLSNYKFGAISQLGQLSTLAPIRTGHLGISKKTLAKPERHTKKHSGPAAIFFNFKHSLVLSEFWQNLLQIHPDYTTTHSVLQ